MRENRIPGMRECQVCGRPFPLVAEGHYVARDCDYVGIGAVLGSGREPMLYDAIDCPHCGCQNVMRKRRRDVATDDLYFADNGHDDCDDCDHHHCENCGVDHGE